MQRLPLRAVSVVSRRLTLPTLLLQPSLLSNITSRQVHEIVDCTYYKYRRPFSTTTGHDSNEDYAQAAKELNQKDLDEQESQVGDAISHEKQEKGKQARTPWHRQGSDVPPVARPRSASAMTKGEQASIDS